MSLAIPFIFSFRETVSLVSARGADLLLLSLVTKVSKSTLSARRPKVLKITATVYDFLFGRGTNSQTELS